MTMILTTGVMVLVIALNETGTLGFNYIENCWIGDFYLQLAFFFIPTVVTYIACFSCLILILYSIKQSTDYTNRSLSGSVSKGSINILHIGIKLIIVLGISESIGLIQIRSTTLTESELILNNTFAVFYNVTRSLRGVLIFVVCLLNKRALKLIQKKLVSRKSSHLLEMSTTTKTTSDWNKIEIKL